MEALVPKVNTKCSFGHTLKVSKLAYCDFENINKFQWRVYRQNKFIKSCLKFCSLKLSLNGVILRVKMIHMKDGQKLQEPNSEEDVK